MTPRRIRIGIATTLLIGVVCGWVRSWDVADAIWLQRGTGSSIAIGASEGSLFLAGYVPLHHTPETGAALDAASFPIGQSARVPILGRQESDSPWTARVGFTQVGMIAPWRSQIESSGPLLPAAPVVAVGRAVYVPHWLVCVLLLGTLWQWGRREWAERNERRQGKCAACGYDLRASPNRCPECGRPVGQPDATA